MKSYFNKTPEILTYINNNVTLIQSDKRTEMPLCIGITDIKMESNSTNYMMLA